MEISTAEKLSTVRDPLASTSDFPETGTETLEFAQTTLSRQEEEHGRLAALVDSSDDAIIGKRLDGTITSWNPGAERLFGYSSWEAVGKSMRMLLPPERADEESDILARIGRGERIEHFETVRVRKDGTKIDVSVTISPIKNSRGTIVGASKIARDISERKRAADELADQKFALDQHAIVAVTDVQGTITYANDKFCAISQYARHEVIGQNHRILKSGHHPKEFFQQMYRTIAHGKVWHGEIKNRAKDGSMYWVDTTIVPLMGGDGKPRQYIAIRTDITELKRVERTLRALSACNDALMRATDESSLLQQICDLVVTVGGYRMAWVGYAEHDEKKTVRAMAKSGFEDSYLDTLKLTWADEERGRGPTGTTIRTGEVGVCNDVVSDPRFAPWREDAIERGYGSCLVLPLRNGEEVLGALSIYATDEGAFDASEQHLLKELSNNLSYGIRALRLRAERQRAEEVLNKSRIANEVALKKLARSNAELEQFAYVASHDLQEPLRMIANYTQLLAERYRGRLDEQADKYIAYAVDGATRMQALIRDLLRFSRAGRAEIEPRATDCRAVVEQAVKNLQAAVQDTGAVVKWNGLPVVKAEPAQLTQVFQNLIANAIKFHGAEKPIIQIDSQKKEHECVFTVSDNGIGIPPEHWEDIFVIFRRLHTRTEYPGNGIGLAICKKIIERHGGKIWIEAQDKPGCRFKFSLPIEPISKAEQEVQP